MARTKDRTLQQSQWMAGPLLGGFKQSETNGRPLIGLKPALYSYICLRRVMAFHTNYLYLDAVTLASW
jgi:hypothetical protein